MDEYFSKYYDNLLESSLKFREHEYKLAREMVYWKNKVIDAWDNINVIEKRLKGNNGKSLLLGESFVAELKIDINGLKESDFGVEVVFAQKTHSGKRDIVSVHEMQKIKTARHIVTYRCEVPAKRTGSFNYAFRMFPKHRELAHRQDFNLIKWI